MGANLYVCRKYWGNTGRRRRWAFWPPILNSIKIICFKQGSQFRSACFPSGLIYYGPASCRQIPYASYFIIIVYYKAFLYFFPNQFFKKYIYFFCGLAQENQEAFSESSSLIKEVLQGLAKICKRYLETNHFSILICHFERYFLVE